MIVWLEVNCSYVRPLAMTFSLGKRCLCCLAIAAAGVLLFSQLPHLFINQAPLVAVLAGPTNWDSITVFYNTFANDTAHALSIINEQLSVRKQSVLQNGNLHYLTIGAAIAFPDCLPCKHLGHYKEGTEMLTLQLLHEHCWAHPSERVIYMHSKGSYHTMPQNDKFRRFLTKSIFSKECVNMPKTCNLCSARFSPLPYPHTPGNMWVATCEYIRRLMPPSRHVEAMSALISQPDAEPIPSRREEELGAGRFAAEHWVASHPSVVPCDLYPDAGYKYGYKNLPIEDWEPELQSAPRFPVDVYNFKKLKYNTEKLFLWRLYEWMALYAEVPPSSSFWRTYYGAMPAAGASSVP